eukprot:3999546-Alexandrium_andersonii.AAC.1
MCIRDRLHQARAAAGRQPSQGAQHRVQAHPCRGETRRDAASAAPGGRRQRRKRAGRGRAQEEDTRTR